MKPLKTEMDAFKSKRMDKSTGQIRGKVGYKFAKCSDVWSVFQFILKLFLYLDFFACLAGPRSVIGRAPDS